MDLNVRIERLPRMWVASVVAVGEAPESEAWRLLREWAEPHGLLNDPAQHPVFGFNNPPPRPGHKEYGYELWLQVAQPEPGQTAVTFKEFEGGLFAVTACKLQGTPDIGTAWRALFDWAQAAPHKWRRAQELEKVLDPNAPEADFVLELYLPIREP